MPLTLELLLEDSEAPAVLRRGSAESLEVFLEHRFREGFEGLLQALRGPGRKGPALGHLVNRWARGLGSVLSYDEEHNGFLPFRSTTANQQVVRAVQILRKLLDNAEEGATLDSIIPTFRAKCEGLPELCQREGEAVVLGLNSGKPLLRLFSSRTDVFAYALAIRLSTRYIDYLRGEHERLGADCEYTASPPSFVTSPSSRELAQKLQAAVPWPQLGLGADPAEDNGADCDSDADEVIDDLASDSVPEAPADSEEPVPVEIVTLQESVAEAPTSTTRPAADFDWTSYRIPRQAKKQKRDEPSASEVNAELDPCVARVDRYLGADPTPPALITEEFKAQCKEFALLKDLAITVKQAREDLFKVVSIQQRNAEFEALQVSLQARKTQFWKGFKHQTPSAKRQLNNYFITPAFERNARWVKSGRPKH